MGDVFGLLTGDTLEGWVLQRLRSDHQFRLRMEEARYDEKLMRAIDQRVMDRTMELFQEMAGVEKGMGPGGSGSTPAQPISRGPTGSGGDE